MTFDLSSIMTLVLETIRNPKAGADAILARRIERGVLWQLLALVTVLSVLAAQITVVLLGPGSGELMGGPLLNSPLLATVIQAALLLALVYATFAIGRAFGGHGTFDDVLALAEPVLQHRMQLSFVARAEQMHVREVIGKLKERIG